MNLVFDIGNTAVKWAVFDGRTLADHGHWPTSEPASVHIASLQRLYPSLSQPLACASGDADGLRNCLPGLSLLDASMPFPIRIGYKTPLTLGPDRIAAACGAFALHPAQPCLIIDAGTCITVDLLADNGLFYGGAIMPGISMNLQALHTFTDKLPLVTIAAAGKAPVLGRTTEECIVAGTLGATLLALAGFVALYREKMPDLQVLLTGGDAHRIAAAGGNGWQLCPQLTLIGLNEVLMMNEQQ